MTTTPLNIIWHASPEDVDRAMWGPIARDAGCTYEDVTQGMSGGFTPDGSPVEMSHEDAIAGMREQRCWAFVDLNTRTIHAWAADDADPELVVHMLAHEVGHATGTPCEDQVQEEERAEQYGHVAAQAFRLFAQRQRRAAAA